MGGEFFVEVGDEAMFGTEPHNPPLPDLKAAAEGMLLELIKLHGEKTAIHLKAPVEGVWDPDRKGFVVAEDLTFNQQLRFWMHVREVLPMYLEDLVGSRAEHLVATGTNGAG